MINSRRIEDLQPSAQIYCKRHIEACAAAGISTKLIQTKRDAEYQNHLYKQGRTEPGKVVTNCDGYSKKSKHQSGLAWDLVPLDSHGGIIWTDKSIYERMSVIAEGLGITAGIRWNSIGDMDHFQVES